MTTECSQTPLVEALRDGRLGTHERASMERHVAGCPDCRSVMRDLERIGETIKAPLPPLTPLEHQRARRALLASAMDDSTHGGLKRKNATDKTVRRLFSFGLVAAMMLVAIASTWALTRATMSSPKAVLALRLRAIPHAPLVDDTTIHASKGARFEHTTDAGLETLKLTSGDLDVHVHALANGDRFLVRTTDAEIEVNGRSFQVAAEDGRIRSVSVNEGSVEVRYAGFTAIIPSGGSWRANDDAKPSLPAEPVAEVAKADRDSDSKRARSGSSHASKPEIVKEAVAPVASAPKPEEAPALPQRSAASLAFSAAMSALAVGDNAGAAGRFRAFSSIYPTDPRADEADYLRAIALQRGGNTKDAAVAGKQYLEARPNGEHRAESESILAGAGP
jgi:ferric-dicitrate binding protein FerR (iron transport regulator)